MKPEPSLSMHTHTYLNLSLIGLINLSQITLGIKLTSACHPKLKQSHKNARYYIAVLHWSAVGKFEAKHREDETNSDI